MSGSETTAVHVLTHVLGAACQEVFATFQCYAPLLAAASLSLVFLFLLCYPGFGLQQVLTVGEATSMRLPVVVHGPHTV